VRVTNEDPAFAPGVLDDLSFRVPFLMYTPQVLQQAQMIPWVTSHVDVMPSILDLLGIAVLDDVAQGAPLWSPTLERRSTLLFAERAMGADGYHDQTGFYMTNYLSGLTCAGPELHFGATSPVPQYSSEQQRITKSIEGLSVLQQVIVEKLAATHSASAATSTAGAFVRQ
jgi:hypothetical protein